MRALEYLALVYLLAACVGCSERDQKTPFSAVVQISKEAPEAVRKKVLSIVIHNPSDVSVTNWQGVVISGKRSLKSPTGSGSDSGGSHEERLIAINADGFKVLFTNTRGEVVQTNAVLFRYGETTDTNTIGWRIVGKYQ
jgi:hypothetical protein